jgi:hypothetical protein
LLANDPPQRAKEQTREHESDQAQSKEDRRNTWARLSVEYLIRCVEGECDGNEEGYSLKYPKQYSGALFQSDHAHVLVDIVHAVERVDALEGAIDRPDRRLFDPKDRKEQGKGTKEGAHQAEIDDHRQAHHVATIDSRFIPVLKCRDDPGEACERYADLDAYQ